MSNFRIEHNDPLAAFLRTGDVANILNQMGSRQHEHVSSQVWNPVVDIYEDSESVVIHADLPGMNEEDIEVELTDDSLTIKGARTFADEPNRGKYVRVERQYGAFQRTFTLGVPIQAESVKAVYRNGVLVLTLPKAEAVKPKKVAVTVG